MDLIDITILVLCGIAAYSVGYAHGKLNGKMQANQRKRPTLHVR